MSLPVTVIIPCHNCGDTLERAIESATEQADCVVLINDATPYGFINEPIERFQRWPGFINYNTSLNVPAGVCYTRNLAVKESPKGLILPLDADDWLVEGVVQKLRDAYKPGHFVYGNWYEVQNNETVEHRPPPIAMIRQKNIGYASFMFHKDDWQAAGGYQSHFNIGGEHWAFMASLIYKAKVKPTYIDSPIFHYDRSESKRYGRANRFHSTIQKMVGEIIDGR